MIRHPLDSTNLRSCGYDPATKTLEVEFGKPSTPHDQTTIYHYKGVTPAEHANLMKADSHGAYFAKHIKSKHTGKKIEQ